MSTVSQPAFRPGNASTVSLSASAASSNVQVQTANTSRHVRIYNSGSVTVFIEQGGSGVTAATATGYPIPAGAVEIISCPEQYIAAITASSTATVYFTPGEGL